MSRGRGLPAISLFSGALGLDLGLEQAGFDIRVAVECNRFAVETIRANRPNVPIIDRKIEEVTTAEILETAGLKVGDPVVISGGPSCQPFSTAGRRGSVGDPRGVMFREFLRVVREARPKFFVMENVRGVLSAAVRHRPLNERGPGFPPLTKEEQLGSALMLVLKELRRLDYYIVFDLMNAADYGVPQTRERVLFLGSRDGEPLVLPTRTHSKERVPGLQRWVSLRDSLKGLKDVSPEYSELSPVVRKHLRKVPAGGNWRDLPPKSQAEALGAAHRSWGGRAGFYRRLSWSRPAPAITTRPDCRATMLCHPDELRPLTVRECARLQQFPDSWQFKGGLPQKYMQIGNAVPVGLGRAVGEALRSTMRKRSPGKPTGTIVCPDAALLERLANRPSTVLNPNRMRKKKGVAAARAWLNGSPKGRRAILRYVEATPSNRGSTRSRRATGGRVASRP